MRTKFVIPDFSTGDIEIRFENDCICIYGTTVGLTKLMELCKQLVEKPKIGHLHLEDYQILTENSLIAAIAIFEGNVKRNEPEP